MVARLPRLSFSLRTLFVLVTVIGGASGYLAWQARIVSHRKELLKEPPHRVLGRWAAVDYIYALEENVPIDHPVQVIASIPLIRRWLGDEAIQFLRPESSYRPDEIQDLRQAFPEAIILSPDDNF